MTDSVEQLHRIRELQRLEIEMLHYIAAQVRVCPVAQMPAEQRRHLRVIFEAALEIEEQHHALRAQLD